MGEPDWLRPEPPDRGALHQPDGIPPPGPDDRGQDRTASRGDGKEPVGPEERIPAAGIPGKPLPQGGADPG